MNLWSMFWQWLWKNQGETSDPPVIVSAPTPRCPYPLTSDNGTMADCKQKHHCHCEDGL